MSTRIISYILYSMLLGIEGSVKHRNQFSHIDGLRAFYALKYFEKIEATSIISRKILNALEAVLVTNAMISSGASVEDIRKLKTNQDPFDVNYIANLPIGSTEDRQEVKKAKNRLLNPNDINSLATVIDALTVQGNSFPGAAREFRAMFSDDRQKAELYRLEDQDLRAKVQREETARQEKKRLRTVWTVVAGSVATVMGSVVLGGTLGYNYYEEQELAGEQAHIAAVTLYEQSHLLKDQPSLSSYLGWKIEKTKDPENYQLTSESAVFEQGDPLMSPDIYSESDTDTGFTLEHFDGIGHSFIRVRNALKNPYNQFLGIEFNRKSPEQYPAQELLLSSNAPLVDLVYRGQDNEPDRYITLQIRELPSTANPGKSAYKVTIMKPKT